MEIDPNWFYSSIAQCSAAIVGIMGAFLISRIIHQKQTANNLVFKINEINRDIKFLQDQEKEQVDEETQQWMKQAMNGDYSSYVGSSKAYNTGDRIIYLRQLSADYNKQLKDLGKNKSLFFGTLGVMFLFGLIGVFVPLGMLLTDYQTMIDSRGGVFIAVFISFILIGTFLLLEILNFNFITWFRKKFNGGKKNEN